jgi:hypothetical protein
MATPLVTATQWDMYKNLMRDAHETFAQKPIVWKRSRGGLDRYGEDNASERFTNINLKGLLQYNAFRTWPINRTSEQGEQDKENVMLILNKQYLQELGYINANGNFAFDPAADRFVFDGRVHKALGDTDTSQDDNEGLWTSIILKREELNTGQSHP